MFDPDDAPPNLRVAQAEQVVPVHTGRRKPIPEFDPRVGDHYWVLAMVFHVNPEERLADGTAGLLDQENFVRAIGPFCHHCERDYTPRESRRRCKGSDDFPPLP